ncbi:MAG: SnoaL-like domain-containing protein [Halobacteria archaeon]|nr:SnoaL-like domain-containing protein [Halobacteria archaeon]
MTQPYNTPQEAEDAFYDALDEGDLNQVLSVWAETDDICCLLPMHPLIQGRQGVTDVFTHLFSRGQGVSLAIAHLGWIETGDIAIHQVEETVQGAPTDAPPPPFYGTNIYRKDSTGWRLIVHQNAPSPPPPSP